MTACIVGWAHTPFGKHDAETVESLIIARGARARWSMPASRPRDIDEIYARPFQRAASPRRISPPRWCCRPIAGFPLQARDPGRERLRHRLRRRAPGA